MQFRVTAHPTDGVTAAVSIENPDQYVGSGIKLPAAFPAGEVDAGSAVNDVPNPFPDIVGKIAFDPRTGATHQHFEAGVLVRSFKTYDLHADTTYRATGTGGSLNAVLEPAKAVRIVAAAFLSSGGGRYLANTNLPDFIVNADSSITRVHTRSYILGAEIQGGARTLLWGYHSEVHADRALATDVDGSAIGFGVEGSTAANERIRETTAGVTHTFFRDPKIGGLQLMAQYSHVRRAPFAPPTGTPTEAVANMLYFTMRYILP
jgi:hypothetical protein